MREFIYIKEAQPRPNPFLDPELLNEYSPSVEQVRVSARATRPRQMDRAYEAFKKLYERTCLSECDVLLVLGKTAYERLCCEEGRARLITHFMRMEIFLDPSGDPERCEVVAKSPVTALTRGLVP